MSISSGAMYGAFGAGVLTEWMDSRALAAYDTVTGVSVGSVLAPVAFLGDSAGQLHPRELMERIAELADRHPIDVSNPVRLFKAISGHGFRFSQELEATLRAVFDSTLIDQVAAQHALGRNLYVASTNVTAGRVVVWDLGAIASGRRSDRVRRFQDAILASMSVPIVMPLRYLKTGKDGAMDLHVDGSVLGPFFATTLLRPHGGEQGAPAIDIDVILNHRLHPWIGPTKVSVRPIKLIPHLLWLMYESQFNRALEVLLLRSHQDDLHVRILSIPENLGLPPSLDFTGHEIRHLFHIGKQTAQNDDSWTTPTASDFHGY